MLAISYSKSHENLYPVKINNMMNILTHISADRRLI